MSRWRHWRDSRRRIGFVTHPRARSHRAEADPVAVPRMTDDEAEAARARVEEELKSPGWSPREQEEPPESRPLYRPGTITTERAMMEAVEALNRIGTELVLIRRALVQPQCPLCLWPVGEGHADNCPRPRESPSPRDPETGECGECGAVAGERHRDECAAVLARLRRDARRS